MANRALRVAAVAARGFLRAGVRARFGMAGGTRRRSALAREFRLACEELGPSFVKIGQLISVRPDVFPAELVLELEGLRDRAARLDQETVRRVILSEFGRPPEELFAAFDPEPVASASMAQVHRATLREAVRPAWGAPLPAGSPVAVKVLRPGAAESVRGDLEAARRGARRLARLGMLRRVDTGLFLDQVEASFERELDLRAEGRVADRFRFNFRRNPKVVIPRVAWALTSRRVLTAEYLDGWHLSDLEGAGRKGVDARGLALTGAAAFMEQVLDHGLFHADLHHANLLVTADGRVGYLDFGIVGALSPEERTAVAQVLAAMVFRDAERALRYSAVLGVSIRPDRVGVMRDELGRLMERTLHPGPGGDIRHFGLGFMGLLRRHGVTIPVGYALLVKALVTVEGVSRELYPEIDLMETARPFVTRLLARGSITAGGLAVALPRAARAALRELMA